MDEPVGAGEAISKKTEGCWKARLSLWIGLIVFLLAVLGRILIYVVPSEAWVSANTYSHYQLLSSLEAVAQSVMYLGAVWVGVYLARWGVCKKKD
jgi:hypothetical protein